MTKYSDCLGVIEEYQFQMALNKFNLGKFIKAEKVPYGIVGQNVFLTSSEYKDVQSNTLFSADIRDIF